MTTKCLINRLTVFYSQNASFGCADEAKFAVNLPNHGISQTISQISGSATETLRKAIVYSTACSSVPNIKQEVTGNSQNMQIDEYDENFEKFNIQLVGKTVDAVQSRWSQKEFTNSPRTSLMIEQNSSQISGSNVQIGTVVLSCPDDENAGIVPQLPTINQISDQISGSSRQSLNVHIMCKRYCNHPVTLNQYGRASGTAYQQANVYFHCPSDAKPKFFLNNPQVNCSGTCRRSASAYHVRTEVIQKPPTGLSC